MKRITRKITAYALIAVMLLAAAGCSSARNASSRVSAHNASVDVVNTTLAAGDVRTADMEYVDGFYNEAASGEAYSQGAPAAADPGSSTSTVYQSAVPSDRMLIRNVSVTCETLNFTELTSNIESQVASLGGYIESKNFSGTGNAGDLRSAYYTIRVTSEALDQLVNTIGNSAVIINSNESTEDVTLSYTDMQARVESLRIEQQTLNDLLAQADDLDIILQLQNELTTVRYQIESYESQMRVLENLSSFSTLTLSISEVLEETEVLDITWQLGKTGEYTPIIWVKPVEMDGRMVQKCSGHNFGYLKEKGVTIGAKVVMSLAGDIIPFLYKVTQPNENGEIPMPTDHEYYEDDIHLMAVLTEEDHNKMKFINSAKTLNIPTLGDSTIKQIYEYIYNNANDSMTLDFFNESVKNVPLNVLLVSSEDIYFGAGAGKIGQNAKKAFEGIIQNISLTDIIKSCNFKLCGEKASEQIAQYLIFGEADWSHIPNEAYSWVYDNNNTNMHELKQILSHLGKDFKDFEEQIIEKKNTVKLQIPVILTGEPNNYSSKGEFLRVHPEYRMTGSWKEVEIVFTNSLESTTGKMKKAKEKGIRIELY